MTCHFRMEDLVDELRVREVDLTFFITNASSDIPRKQFYVGVGEKCVISLYKKHVKFVKN